jgi:hypothetical protein
MLGFGFLAQNPLPGLALANTRAPCCHHGINLHPPPHNITPHRRFTRHAQNRATNARFQFFGPNPARQPRVGERMGPLLPPRHQPAPTTSQHHPTPPFHTARPKSRHERSVSGFWPKPRSPASRWRTHEPPAAATASTCTHDLPASPHAAVSHGTPETDQRTLGFDILAPNREPPPPGVRPNKQPQPWPHLTYLTASIPPGFPLRCFEQRAPKLSHDGSVSTFWPKSETPRRAIEQVAAPAPAPHQPHPSDPPVPSPPSL